MDGQIKEITVEQAWEVVKKDVLEKIKQHEEPAKTFTGALGLGDDYVEKEEAFIDELVDAVRNVTVRSAEVSTLISKARSIQEFVYFCNVVYHAQGSARAKQEIMLGALKQALEE